MLISCVKFLRVGKIIRMRNFRNEAADNYNLSTTTIPRDLYFDWISIIDHINFYILIEDYNNLIRSRIIRNIYYN